MRETLVDIPVAAALLVADRGVVARGVEVDDVDEATVGAAVGHPVHDRTRLAWTIKRSLDLIGACVLLLLALPLLAVIALVVMVTSDGPAIYRSRRVGRGGRQFDCLKFRTMADGADCMQADLEQHNEADGPLFKIDGDPRITPFGGWLRRTSLDELPQLWNVVRGEMSLVGPRPLPLRDVSLLAESDHHRHAVRPGMTGVWQVSPDRHGSGNDIISLDLAYIDDWSLRGDLVLLLRTAFVVLDGIIGRRSELN